MLTKELIERIYSAASIQRWNDHVRPAELTELDKQAHKMIFAYVLVRFEEEAAQGLPVDRDALIQGGIFEFFHRIMLTDIKPEVFHEMMSKKGDEINRWVVQKLCGELEPLAGGLQASFERYFFDPAFAANEKKILRAAHYLATRWEFTMLYPLNTMMYGIEKTRGEIDAQLQDYRFLAGVREIFGEPRYEGFLDLCGQLRFQQRWAQTPRIPKTSVLGHMLVVALLSYLVSLEIGAGVKRRGNNFFTALFHDLPEVLTRDIVSPIKASVQGLESIIRDYEKKQIDEKILPLLPASWHPEMRFFIENEFKNRVNCGGKTQVLERPIEPQDDAGDCSAADGQMVRVCDKLAAYIEASLSLSYGIVSQPLVAGKEDTYRYYRDRTFGGFEFRPLFEYFQP